MFHELIVHKLCQKFNVYLGSRIGNDNRGRGHSYANRIITAPNKSNPAFTWGLERKTPMVQLGNLHHSDNYNSILAKK